MMLLSAFIAFILHFSFPSKNPDVAPPGTIRFQENKFIDAEVVTNWGWKEFLYCAKRDSSLEFYQAMLPDTSKIVNGRNYFNAPEFADKPVVGITHTQALIMCQWRSNMVSHGIIHPEKLCVSAQRDYAKYDKTLRVIYRLPQPEELKMVSEKPKKVKTAANLEEITAVNNLVVENAFTSKVKEKKINTPASLNRTFRCVAYFEKQ